MKCIRHIFKLDLVKKLNLVLLFFKFSYETDCKIAFIITCQGFQLGRKSFQLCCIIFIITSECTTSYQVHHAKMNVSSTSPKDFQHVFFSHFFEFFAGWKFLPRTEKHVDCLNLGSTYAFKIKSLVISIMGNPCFIYHPKLK